MKNSKLFLGASAAVLGALSLGVNASADDTQATLLPADTTLQVSGADVQIDNSLADFSSTVSQNQNATDATATQLPLISADKGVNEITVRPGDSSTTPTTPSDSTGMSTVKFTAKWADGRVTQYSWTFPSNSTVTYAYLFQLAGLNPADWNLTSQTYTTNNAINATNAQEVEVSQDAADVSAVGQGLSFSTGDGETDLVFTQNVPTSAPVVEAPAPIVAPTAQTPQQEVARAAVAATLPATGEADQAATVGLGLMSMAATIALVTRKRRQY
jgi:LPXTG-motif cell wall-anchored protein